MSRKRIFTIGAKELRIKSNPITKFDGRLGVILRDMADTMYHAEGIGLAAPQVGITRRLVVADVGEGLIEFVNPEISDAEGSCGMVEGCLSVPGRRGFVTRPEKVTIKAQDRTGKPFTMEADGLLARCIQHEIDHLDGVLYVDKMDHEVFPEDEEEDKPSEGGEQ
ncbi:MAG: peptide deformylase [Christensenellales bacterium]|jgi:peptide deformylase